MDTEKYESAHAQSILIASGSEKGIEYFKELAGGRFAHVVYAQSAAEAAGHVARMPFDVIIINAPLSDELGDRFAVRIQRPRSCDANFHFKNQ